MKVLFSPQYNAEKKIHYEFNQTNLKVTIGDEVTFFDLSKIEPNKQYDCQMPVLDVTNVDGEIRLVLLNYVDDNATESELFPHEFEPELTEFEATNVLPINEVTPPKRALSELELMQAKLDVALEHNKFLEDCIVEMASVVYG